MCRVLLCVVEIFKGCKFLQFEYLWLSAKLIFILKNVLIITIYDNFNFCVYIQGSTHTGQQRLPLFSVCVFNNFT